MTETNAARTDVLNFLRGIGQDQARRERLRFADKSTVLADARAQGYQFDEADFDTAIWETEVGIAKILGEPFDFSCSMWETMWGKYYLDYLIENVAEVAV